MAARLVEDRQSSQRLPSLIRLVARTMRKEPGFSPAPDGCYQWEGFSPASLPVEGRRSTASGTADTREAFVSHAAPIGGDNGSIRVHRV